MGAKQKTHKASSKVLKVKKNGEVTYKHAGGNHKTAKDTTKSTRQRKNQGKLFKGDANRIKSVI